MRRGEGEDLGNKKSKLQWIKSDKTECSLQGRKAIGGIWKKAQEKEACNGLLRIKRKIKV